MNQYLLRLFVSGQSATTRRAVANLQRVCDDELSGRFQIEVIDVAEHPELAEQERILATPTLIKQLPLPVRRVIGDLADAEQVLMGLDLLDLLDLHDPPESDDRDDGAPGPASEGPS